MQIEILLTIVFFIDVQMTIALKVLIQFILHLDLI